MTWGAHLDDTANILDSVEGGYDRDSAFPEFGFDVEGNFYICPINIRNFFITALNS
jgi:hypothetical protein